MGDVVERLAEVLWNTGLMDGDPPYATLHESVKEVYRAKAQSFLPVMVYVWHEGRCASSRGIRNCPYTEM